MKMTATWLESRRETRNRPTERYDVTVDGREGLMVRVFPSGAVSFRFRYTRSGKRYLMVLGEFGDGGLTLADAFDMHHQAQRELELGLDPIEERHKRDEAKERAREEREGAGTVADLVEQFVHRKLRGERWDGASSAWVRDAKAKTKARKRPDAAAALLGYVNDAGPPRRKRTRKAVPTFVGQLGKVNARELTRRQIVGFLDSVVDRGASITANRIHALLAQLFEWAAGKDLIPASPMAGVERPGGDEKARERVLTPEEIRAFWLKLDTAKMAEPTKLALKLLLVTGQRRGELTQAKWSHFDLDGKLWTIPLELLKSSHSRRENLQPQTVPLSPLALEILRRLKTLSGDSPYVLPAHASKRHSKPYSEGVLSRTVRQNAKHFGIAHWTPHDLRRTCRTGLSSLKVEPHIAERVIGHSLGKMLNTYDKHDPIEQKRVALEKWAEHLQTIIAGRAQNPAPTERAA